MDFKTGLSEKYHSTHYVHFVPQTREGWAWVLDRIRLNFEEVLSPLSRDSRILDIGCGVGYLEHYLLSQGFQDVECIDLSGEQIAIAKQKLTEYGIDFSGKIKFVVANAFDYLRRSDRYDVVAMFDVIEHFAKEEIGQLLELSYAALRPGGLLLLRTINADNPLFGRFFYHDFTHETPFTPDSIRQCMAGAGFKIDKLDYEKVGRMESTLMGRLKGKTRERVLAKLLGIAQAAFAEDLIAVARK